MARILVIDDEELIRFALREILEGDGYDVEEAEDGEIGLARLAESGIDLVVTDIVMPNKEGIETIAEIREFKPDLPILAISGGGRIGAVDHLARSREVGASDILRKPFSDEELLEKVASLLAA